MLLVRVADAPSGPDGLDDARARDARRADEVAGAKTRRDALAWASVVLLGTLGVLTGRAWRARPTGPRLHVVKDPLADGLTIDGPVALFREGQRVTAVSRRCPHLGCEVRAAGDGTLACPCHGSRFDARGQLRRGPAAASLTPLNVRTQADGKVVVDLVD